MLLKVYKSRVWMLLLMLLPFIGNAQIPGLPPDWGFTLNPTSATYAVPTTVTFTGVTPLAAGDWIGVFYQDGAALECGGAIQWDGVNNVAVVAFGNDGLNPNKNGFADNEFIHWKFYYSVSQTEICVSAYDAANAQFNWVNGDLDAVASFVDYPIVTCPSNMTGVKTTDPAFTLTGGLPAGGTYSGTGVSGNVFTPSVAGVGTHTITYTFTEFDCSDYCTFTIQVIPGTVTQTITVNNGWNWISFNVLPTDARVNVVLAGYVAQNNDQIKAASGAATYSNGTWYPTAFTISPNNRYLLKRQNANPGTINVVGNNVDVSVPVNLVAGWNWIGYKPHSQQAVNTALSSIVPAPVNNDQVKWSTGAATYSNGTWYPTTFQMIPGRGYLYKSANGNAVLTYHETKSTDVIVTEKNKDNKSAPNWPEPTGYEKNMVINAQVQVGSTLITTPGSLLSAWKGDEIRGVGEIFEGPAGWQWLLVAVSNLDTESGLTMKVWDAGTDQICDIEGTFTFTNNGEIGFIFEPVIYSALCVVPEFGTIMGTVTNSVTAAPISNVSVTATWAGLLPTDVAPNWPEPTGYEKNMVINAQVQVGSTLITTPGSLLSAWKGDEIRGVGEIFEGPAGWQWLLVAVSNLDTESGLTMKVWDAGTDQICDIEGTFTFTNNGEIGFIFEPVIYTALCFTPPGPYVTTTNIEGNYVLGEVDPGLWNMVATHPDFEDGVANNVAVVIGQTNTVDFALVPTTPPCEDVVISYFPEAFENLCVGAEFTYDFSDVIIENAVNVVWSVDPAEAGTFGGPDGDDFTLNTEYVGLVTITVDGYATPPCMDASASVEFEVYPLPEVTCPNDFSVCINDAPWALYGASPEGGVFSGVGVVDNWYYPELAGVGTFEITYTFEDANGCVNSCTFLLTVNALPIVECPQIAPVCEGSDFITFPPVVNGVYTDAGGQPVQGFDPVVAGDFGFTLTVTDGNGCVAFCEFTIVVNALPDVTCPEDFAICVIETVQLVGGMPEGGVYSGNGVVEGVFNSLLAGLGPHTITYTFTDENGCSNSCEFVITVNDLPAPVCPNGFDICIDAEPVVLEGALPEGGTYGGDGVMDGVFYPEVAGLGYHELFYTYTDPQTECTGFCVFGVTVNPVPEIECPAYEPFCEGDDYVMFEGSGVYTYNGEIVQGFDPVAAGEYLFEYTVTNEFGCDAMCEFVIVVNALPEVSCPADFWVCFDEQPWMLYGAEPEGGIYSGVGVMGGMFDPAAAGVGYHEITYTYTDVNGCTNFCAFEIHVKAMPVVYAGPDANIEAGNTYTVETATVNNVESFLWTTYGDGAFDDALLLNPTYTPGPNDIAYGSVILELVGYSQYCGAAYDQMTLFIGAVCINPPTVFAGEDAAVCAGDSYTLADAAATNYIDVQWYTLTGDGQFDNESALNPVYNPGLLDIITGYVELCVAVTPSDPLCQPVFDCMILTINPLPVVECPVIEPVCEGSDYIEFPLFEGGVYTCSMGNVVTGFDPVTAGTYGFTLTVTDQFGCSASCGFEIVVNPLPVFDCPAYGPFCEGDGAVAFEGEGVYTFNGEVVAGFDPVAAGEYLFVYTVTNDNGCSASCEFTIVVNPLPWLEYSASSYEVCLGEVVNIVLTGPEDGAYPFTVGYSINGFSNTDVVEGSYIEYSYSPDFAGTYNFVIESITSADGCTTYPNTPYTLVVNPLPTYSYEVSASEICYGEEITYTEYFTGTAPWTVEYYWNGVLETFTTSENPSITTEALFETSTYEPVSVTDGNGCVSVVNQPITIIVHPLPVFDCPAYGPFCEGGDAVALEGEGVYTLGGEVITEFEPVSAGVYSLVYTVTTEFGCSEDCEFEIVVNAAPTYSYEVSSTEVCINTELTWTEYFTGTAPWTVEYLWNGELETYTTFDNPSTTIEVMDEAGVFVYEPVSVTDGNGCTSVVSQPVTITVLPLTEIVQQPVNAEVLYGEDAEFVVIADNATGYQWFEVGVGEIFGATNATLELTDVTVNSAYYCEVYGECNTEISDVATLTILPWTQVIPFPARVSGMSTYLDIIDCDIATILAPVGANLQGAQFYQPTKIYAPGSPTFCWDESKGSAVTLKNNIWPTSVSVTGFPTLGSVVNLGAGWNIIPVWSQGVVNAADVFGPLGNGVRAFTVDYTGVYWPQYNLYSLQYLVPGNAYFVFVPVASTLDFDVPLVDATPGYVSLPPNMTSWNDVTLTGMQHIIAITTEALASLEVGDVIGAFNQNGTIAGMLEITSQNENTVLRVYGDESMTQEVEGFVNGDMMTFRVYRNGVEIDVVPTFEQKLPNTSIFEVNGASAIIALKAGTTSINEVNSDLNVNVYPNPATSFVNIQTNFEIKSLKVVNYVGQVVFDQIIGQVNYQINTSDFVSGMYFVQIEANDGTIVTKRLTIN